MIRAKIHTLSKPKQHLASALLSVLCMAAAVAVSSLYYYFVQEISPNITLIFLFFLIFASSNTVGYGYGICCSLFIVLWYNYRFTFPYHKVNFSLEGYPITFLFMCSITIFISTLTSHLVRQADLIAKWQKELAEAEKERTRANLLHAISHDLRTPLTGIVGSSLAYLENGDFLSEEDKSTIVRNIYEDSTWLIHMVENLLTVTRIDRDKLSISTREEPVEEVVAEALQRTERRYEGSMIQVSIPDEFIMIPMDAVLIEQVTINLLENALLHSGTTAPVELIVENHPDNVSFTIRDHGTGIPAEMLPHLFEGTDYISDTPDIQKGMGIGLVVCKTIITAHHGTIIGRNHRDGAEFTFTLPKRKEASDS